MRFLKLSTITLLLCVLLAGCKLPWSSSTESTPDNQTVISSPAAQKLLVVNVLGSKYYKDAHIQGSIHVPFEMLETKARDWDKSTAIVVYCANYQCTSSAEAVRRLKAQGFTNVKAYEGGTAEWHTKKYPIEGPAQENYLTMVGTPVATHDIEIITADQLLSEIQKAEKAGTLVTS